jgi:hypothetical protein
LSCLLQVLSAKAEQLVVTTFELQELHHAHKDLQANLEEVQHRLSTVDEDLLKAQ